LAFKSQNSSLYQEFYSKEADNDIFSRNYLYYGAQNRLYPYAIGYWSTNFRRKVNSRYFVGGGATYQIIQTPKSVLKLSGNLVYEESRFNASTFSDSYYNGSDKISLWRATAYLSGWSKLFDGHLRLFYDAYWQPALDRADNYRTQFDLGLEFPIWNGLAFTILYAYTRENVVPTVAKTTDNILTFGLSYLIKSKNK
jgi:hypothetical protein